MINHCLSGLSISIFKLQVNKKNDHLIQFRKITLNLKIKQNLKYTHKTVNLQAGVRYTHKSALKTTIHVSTLQSSVCVKILHFRVLTHTHIHSLFREILWALWYSDWYCWRFTSVGCDAMSVGEQLPVLWWHYYPSEHHTLWCSVGRWAAPNALRTLLSFRTSCTTCPMTQCHSPEDMNLPQSILFCIFY
jgi:hypothetical protein